MQDFTCVLTFVTWRTAAGGALTAGLTSALLAHTLVWKANTLG